eukprot:4417998-Pyramimonas_sp.AAC.2
MSLQSMDTAQLLDLFQMKPAGAQAAATGAAGNPLTIAVSTFTAMYQSISWAQNPSGSLSGACQRAEHRT